MSSRRSSQFATAPRFSTQLQTRSSQSLVSSPLARRERVEDFDASTSDASSVTLSSPVLYRARTSRAREQIEDNFSGHVQDNSDLSGTQTIEPVDDDDAPTFKRRKIPPPPAWPRDITSGSYAVATKLQSLHTPELQHAEIVTPERIKRNTPAVIASSPSSDGAEKTTVSPAYPSTATSLSGRRKTPRFDFGRSSGTSTRIISASNGLQRVTGTSQFILPPALDRDDYDEATTLTNTNLALLFSPQKYKRYQYAPGGMAATVRDWVLGAAVGTTSSAMACRFRARTAQPGQRGLIFVLGVDKVGDEQKFILLGAPQGIPDAKIEPGKMVVVMEPSWTIELDATWRVGVRWRLDEQVQF